MSGWPRRGHAWIRERLEDLDMRLTGPVEQIHDRPWSTVLRVPTDRGDQFFKASAPALGHEAAIVAFLAGRLPEVIPAPLAVDLEQGWMLMDDAGMRLRELVEAERDVSRWLDVLPLYAGLQVDLAGAAADLLRLGAPDMRLAVLPARYEALLDELVASDALGELDRLEAAGGDDRPGVPAALPSAEMRRLRHAVPRVAAMCTELAGYGLAETIQHDDLNDGAVYAREAGWSSPRARGQIEVRLTGEATGMPPACRTVLPSCGAIWGALRRRPALAPAAQGCAPFP